MEEFDIPPEELERIRVEAEAKHRAELEKQRREAAESSSDKPGTREQPAGGAHQELASFPPVTCPQCGFGHAWDGVRCKHCNYVMPGAAPEPRSRRSFFPHMTPSMPVSELVRYPGVMLLVGCWLSMAVVLVLALSGLWAEPAKVEYPSRAKVASDEEFQGELSKHKKWQAYRSVTDYAAAGLGGILTLGLGLYFNMTALTKRGKIAWNAWGIGAPLVIIGIVVIYAAPFVVGFSVWRYLAL